MSGGIDSQYGFLFQKYVFTMYVIANASTLQYYTYEGIEDIDVNGTIVEQYVAFISGHNETKYIQVKSGELKKEHFYGVVANFLNEKKENTSETSPEFKLYLENELSFEHNTKTMADEIAQKILDGKFLKKNAKFNKAFRNYETEIGTDELSTVVRSMLDNMEICCYSIEEIEAEINKKYIELYCSGIKNNAVKELRATRFIEYVSKKIDESIKEKASYLMGYKELMELIQKVNNEISDDKYTIDVATTKKKKKAFARKFLEENSNREIHQLKEVFPSDDERIIQSIVEELIYKDFRNIYEQSDHSTEISNIEDNAKDNFDEMMYGIEIDTPQNRFFGIKKSALDSKLMPTHKAFRNGCYIYLTSEGVNEDIRISWKEDENE